MADIKRFNQYPSNRRSSYLYPAPDGEWVWYTDHKSALSALREENERLRACEAPTRKLLDAARAAQNRFTYLNTLQGKKIDADMADELKQAIEAMSALTHKEQGNG